MKRTRYFIIVLIILVALGFGVAKYLGFLTSVNVIEKEIGPLKMVCFERYGDYKLSGVFMDSIYNSLKKDGFETTKGFGIYYHKPGTIAVDSLHSIVGCIIDPKDTSRIFELERKGYQVREMGKTSCMVVEFPLRSKWSIIAGIRKAYPALEKYIIEKNYQSIPNGKIGAMEIYEQDKIFYIIEIRKQ